MYIQKNMEYKMLIPIGQKFVLNIMKEFYFIPEKNCNLFSDFSDLS